jgi:cytochrome c6
MMNRAVRSHVALALAISLGSAVGFAQSAGEATYKAKCQGCHGAAGTPSPGMAKMMNVKAVSDPDIKKLTADQMFDSVKNGKGKMQPFKDKLSDQEIKDSVAYYRSLK